MPWRHALQSRPAHPAAPRVDQREGRKHGDDPIHLLREVGRRRVARRFANEIVLAHCAEREPPSWAAEALDELPSLMGRARSRDRALEQAVIYYVEAVTLAPHIGERFLAVVTDVDEEHDRGRVQLRHPAVVTAIPTDGLTLGAEVELELDAVDPDERRVHFSLVATGSRPLPPASG